MTTTQIGATESTTFGFRFFTTGKPQRALEQLQSLPAAHDCGSGILILSGVETITFGSVIECVPTPDECTYEVARWGAP